MALVSDVNADVRSRLGDDDNAVFLDAILLPFVKRAYSLVQMKLVNRGCSVLRDTATLSPTVSAGTTLLSSASSPALPADLIVPYKLWERPTGSTEADWVPMHAKDTLPSRVATDTLGEWVFEAGSIDLVGATTTRDVRISYERVLPALTGNSSPIAIISGEDAVAGYAAAFAARSRNKPILGKSCEDEADQALEELSNRFTHGNQGIDGRRRRGYGRKH